MGLVKDFKYELTKIKIEIENCIFNEIDLSNVPEEIINAMSQLHSEVEEYLK